MSTIAGRGWVTAHGGGRLVSRCARRVSAVGVTWWAGALMLVGAALRIERYLADWSLWVDEAMLAFNIVELPPTAFFEQPLPYFQQAAPVGFLLLEKLAVTVIGPSSFGLRLVPLLFALASLPLMWAVARRCLPTGAALAALALLAVLEGPIYWAANAKQYAGDLTITLLLLWLALRAAEHGYRRRDIAALAGVGALCVWLSHPSIFVLAGVGTVMFITALTERRWLSAARLTVAGTVWLISFGLGYMFVYAPVGEVDMLHAYWADGFMPLPPTSMQELLWFPRATMRVFKHLFGMYDDISMPPVGVVLSGLAGAAFVVGLIVQLRRDGRLGALLLSPIVLVLVASGLELYPARGRMLLFIVPVIVLMIAQTVALRRDMTAMVMLGALIFGSLMNTVVYKGMHMPGRMEVQSALAYVQRRASAGDVLLMYPELPHAARYDWAHVGRYTLPAGVRKVTLDRKHWPEFGPLRKTLRGGQRVWVMMHYSSAGVAHGHRPLLLAKLDGYGKRAAQREWVGAAVYLYVPTEQTQGQRARSGAP